VWTPSRYNETIRHLLDLLGRTVAEISEDRVLAWGNMQVLNQNVDMIIPGARCELKDDEFVWHIPEELTR
jgi:hypothetical protein